MSYSPRQIQYRAQSPQKQVPHSLSPIKWNKLNQNNHFRPNVVNCQRFANNLSKHDICNGKTQIKFYQKTNKKIQTTAFKQRIDSIKPLSCNQYEKNQFVIQSKQSAPFDKSKQLFPYRSEQMIIQTSQIHTPCIGLINPMYINVKSNLKRLANSCNLMKQKQTRNMINLNKTNTKNSPINPEKQFKSAVNSPIKKQRKNQTLYYKIVSEMNEYFNSMKLGSFKNNKTQFLTRRNQKSQNQRKDNPFQKTSNENYSKKVYYYEEQNQDQNLNVVGLRPKTNNYQRINRNYSSNQSAKNKVEQQNQKQKLHTLHVSQSQQIVSLSPSRVEKRESQYNIQDNQTQSQRYNLLGNMQTHSMIICNDIFVHQSRLKGRKSILNSRPLTQQIRATSPTVKRHHIYKGMCFGQINLPRSTPQQIYKIKVLYYKDLLWKNAFNLGLKYLPSKKENQDYNLKYFVGKGNNSKLIKNLMSKRWWWSFDYKQQNSQFVWTQLKIYSIYQKQKQKFQQAQISTISQIETKQTNKDQLVNEKTLKNINKLKDNSAKILNSEKRNLWQKYIENQQNLTKQKKATEQNLNNLRKKLINKVENYQTLQSSLKITNHLQFSKAIGNKKALYKVMMLYFQKVKKYSQDQIFVPLTYHITAGLQDQQYLKFLTQYYKRNKNQNKTCWIVKPGELTNRGKGIQYCRDLNQIKPIIKKKQVHSNGSLKTFLIQQYLDRPLLYRGRKFDIRHYIMLSSINGKIRGYFYQGGYIRTTSYKYKLDDNYPAIHLTNDAVQKYCKDYGKYEKGNKLSYQQFDQYMKEKYPSENDDLKIDFFNTIHPQIKKISTDVIHAAYHFVDPKRKINNFEIFGLDIMIDENLKCYLIEVNTNPCLQLSSPVLRNVIPEMLDNALALTLDTCYPPPEKQYLYQYSKKYKYPLSFQNKFQLVFDEDQDGSIINKIYKNQNISPNQMAGIGDDDQNFQSCQQDDEDC